MKNSRKPSNLDSILAEIAATTVKRNGSAGRVVVVGGPKGGSGKTTTSAVLSLMYATREWQPVVVCADTSGGTLLDRMNGFRAEKPQLPFLQFCADAASKALAPNWMALEPYYISLQRVRVLTNNDASPDLVARWNAEEFAAGLEFLRSLSELTIVDLGSTIAGPIGVEALEQADALVLAAPMDQAGLDKTIEILRAMAGVGNPIDDDTSLMLTNGRFKALALDASIVVSEGTGRQDRKQLDESGHLDWLRQASDGKLFVVPEDKSLVGTGRAITLGGLSAPAIDVYGMVARSVLRQLNGNV